MLKREPRFLESSHFTCLISTQKIRNVVIREGENSIGPGCCSRLGDGRRSGTTQTENTVRHTKSGRMRGDGR